MKGRVSMKSLTEGKRNEPLEIACKLKKINLSLNDFNAHLR